MRKLGTRAFFIKVDPVQSGTSPISVGFQQGTGWVPWFQLSGRRSKLREHHKAYQRAMLACVSKPQSRKGTRRFAATLSAASNGNAIAELNTEGYFRQS